MNFALSQPMNLATNCLLVLIVLLQSDPAASQNMVLDDFEDLSQWSAIASEGARIEIAQDTGHTGMGMRVDFDLEAGGGYAIVHRDLPLDLPESYVFSFYLRAEAPMNNVEFKLLDASGNVWWRQRRDYSFPTEWRQILIKKRHIGFAWGPAGGGV